MRFLSAGRTDLGTVRRENEDGFVDLPSRGVWAVADGMGGHHAGAEASKTVCETLSDAVSRAGGGSVAASARQALDAANRTIVQSNLHGAISGATAVVLVAEGEQATCLWVGDSRLYRFRLGSLEQLTHDHSVVQELVDRGELSESDAGAHPLRNRITRAVGIDIPLELASTVFIIAPGDFFLLCTDGLTGALPLEVIERIVRGSQVTIVTDALIDAALNAGADDNVTVVTIKAVPERWISTGERAAR